VAIVVYGAFRYRKSRTMLRSSGPKNLLNGDTPPTIPAESPSFAAGSPSDRSTLSKHLSTCHVLALIALMCAVEMTFISANLTNAVTVQLKAWSKALDTLDFTLDLLKIGLKSGTEEFWDGQAQLLSVFYCACSGVFPHVHFLLLAASLFYPMTHDSRRQLLSVMCFSSKWCLFNMTLLAFMIVAFYTDAYEYNTIEFIVEAIPEYGSASFFTASVGLVLLVHYFAHLHERSYHEHCGKLQISRFRRTNWITTVCLILCLGFVVPGIFLPIVHFDIDGAAAAVLPKEQLSRDLSTWSIINDLTHDVDDKAQALFMFVLFTLCCAVIPVISIVLRLVLVSMCQLKHQFLDDVITFCAGLYAMDVFWVCAVSNAIEMETLSSFIMDKQFPEICNPLKEQFETECFRVTGSLRPGAYWMLASIIFYYASSINLLFYDSPDTDARDHVLLVNEENEDIFSSYKFQ